MSTRGIELELPDLPEVPIRLGAPPLGPKRVRVPLGRRLREAFWGVLPLVLMAMLALGTWWLVKNSPRPPPARVDAPPRIEPDYTMRGFAVRRFDAQGEQKARIEGQAMRHYESPERVEIDEARVLLRAPDGREAWLRSRRAVTDAKGEQVQLLGEATVTTRTADGQPLRVRGESLVFDNTVRELRSTEPVRVESGASVLQAAGLVYEHDRRHLSLTGPVRGVYVAQARP